MSSFNKKTKSPGWKRGGHWVECERTGFAIRNWDAREEWDGTIVAKEEWEPRHPQDYLKAIKDDQSPVGLVSTEKTALTANYSEAIAGIAVAGVAIVGLYNEWDTTVPESTYPLPTGQVALA